MLKHKQKIYKAALSIFIFFTSVSVSFAEYALNMTKGVTTVSRDIYGLHMLVFWICVAIGVIVFGLMIYSIFAHRKSKGAKAANFHESTKIEIVWTLIPLAILIVVAFPATTALLKLEDGSKSDMSIKITGYQWKWQYEYMDDGVGFFSNLAQTSKDEVRTNAKLVSGINSMTESEGNGDPRKNTNYLLDVDKPLVVPINKKIRLLMTSKDVIHSWWVPETGVKQDAIPGFINDAWMNIEKAGTYRGQCAELCGKDHGFMPIVVEAKTQEDYDTWLASQKQAQVEAAAGADKEWSMTDLMAQGKKVYNTNCAACHGQTGAGIPGAFPALAKSPIATGDVKSHIKIVMDGAAGTAMQAYKGQLTDADLAAVITYERNAFDNNVGDLVQPSTIKSAR